MAETKAEKLAEIVPNIETSHAGSSIAITMADAPKVVEAPVLVVAPTANTSTNDDNSNKTKIATGGGTAATGQVDTDRDFIGRDKNDSDLRYNTVDSKVNFSLQDNAILWQSQMKLLQDIADVAFRLDDLPNRLKMLERWLLLAGVTLIGVVLLLGGLFIGFLLFNKV